MTDGKVGFFFFRAKNLPSKRKMGAKGSYFSFISPLLMFVMEVVFIVVRRMLDHLSHAQTHTKKDWLGNVI